MGSLIHPWMGMALSEKEEAVCQTGSSSLPAYIYLGKHTLVEHITHWAIIKDHDLAQVRLDRAQVLDVSSMPVCAMLPVEPL